MNYFPQKQTIERKLKKVRNELRELKEAKRIILSEKPRWKTATLTNHGKINPRRNTVIEESELCFPWFYSQEKTSIYDTHIYLTPFTIKLVHQFGKTKKPYEIKLLSPSGNKIKSKRFLSLSKATEYTVSLQKTVEKLYEKRAMEVDKVIERKHIEVLAIEKAYNVFISNFENKRRTKKIS